MLKRKIPDYIALPLVNPNTSKPSQSLSSILQGRAVLMIQDIDSLLGWSSGAALSLSGTAQWLDIHWKQIFCLCSLLSMLCISTGERLNSVDHYFCISCRIDLESEKMQTSFPG